MIEDVNREHRPDLEQTAYNQMPKDNEFDQLKLYQFVGTDLFQWRGHRRLYPEIPGNTDRYVWDDPATEVFRIVES